MSPLVTRLVGAAIVALVAALQFLIKDPVGLSQGVVTLLQMFATILGLLLPTVLSGAAQAKVARLFRRGGTGVSMFLLVIGVSLTAPADQGCKGPVSPNDLRTVLTIEQETCVVVGFIAGARTPPEFAAVCPMLPILTQDVVAAINAVIGATQMHIQALPPDGLGDAGAPAAPPAMVQKLKAFRAAHKDGGS